ncbi:RtcB family protein [Candidatus Azambacteria bacterium]|nr:RtcB family protein [Candidatus Azambacteria bacterium]
MISKKDLKKISEYVWEIPRSFRSGMRVPARIYITEKMLDEILDEKAIEQLVNVATLPGVERCALAMPDIHQGYGFPIGGVAAFRTEDGVISPGGVGYDINCGVRLLLSKYSYFEIKDKLPELATGIQKSVPSGVGRGGKLILGRRDFDEVLNMGVNWALKNGYAKKEDLEVLEESGCYAGADASLVSDHAKKRGADQLGTIGSGNHFLEVQEVDEIYDEKIAKEFGLSVGQVTVMIHTGSRGLGHQVCTDYVRLMDRVIENYNIHLPDRELACAPFRSKEGREYFQAMAAAANFAWTNRQVITHSIREVFKNLLKNGEKDELDILYDVAHNIAKLEKHEGKEYIVHRKGATRAFGPESPELPGKYQKTGQPVLIPGSMGTYSYVLAGTERSMTEAFGSSCHGAGRRISRVEAKRRISHERLKNELDKYGVVVRAGSKRGLVEEAPEAYKDVNDVVDVVSKSGLAKKVAKLKPLAVIKG